MTLVSDQIAIASGGEFSVAPVGTALPTTVSGDLDAAFQGLGWSSDDGGTITTSVSETDVAAWGSGGSPVFTFAGSSILEVKTVLLQNNAFNVALWAASAEFTEVGSSGEFESEIPILGVVQQFALVVSWTQNTFNYRLIVTKAKASAEGELQLSDKDVTKYGVKFTALAPDTGYRAKIITDDPAFELA